MLAGETNEDRLHALFRRLMDIRPGRIFLFHHPADPLAVIVAQPEVAAQFFLVHHADATPSLGLTLPGVTVIELNPTAAALARIQGLSPELLMLTAPDPGPRPNGFLRKGRLVTAASGGAHKFTAPHFYGYADTVATILRTTGGWHVHIGPLAEDTLAEIHAALTGSGVADGRLVHVPWVPSVSKAMWDYECDVYLASFPIDGGRTYVEVAASATPYLAHRVQRTTRTWALSPAKVVWSTWEDLAGILKGLSNESLLAKHARTVRAAYDRFHHPDVFRQSLANITAGRGGVKDPDADERDQAAFRSLAMSALRRPSSIPD